MDARHNHLTALGLTLVLGHGLSTPGLAQEAASRAGTSHPEILDVMDWKSATYLLDSDGTVKDPNEYAEVRTSLNNQSARFKVKFGSASGHGLREGQVPPRSFCVPSGVNDGGGDVLYVRADYAGLFDAAVLLGEVAVAATIEDIVPGFSGSWPYNLLALSGVVPLHEASPLPDYVLVPVFSMVTHDLVFCGGEREKPFVAGVDYKIGARVIVVGSWHRGSVVPMGLGAGKLGLLAEVTQGRELKWLFSPDVGRPESVSGLEVRIADMSRRGLLGATSDLRRQPDGSEGRGAFGGMVYRLHRSGCRLVGAEPLPQPDEGWRYTRICAAGTPEEAARKLDRPVVELCTDTSTTRSTSTGGPWGPAESCSIEH